MRPRIHRQLLPFFNAYSKKANDVQMYKANVLKIFMATSKPTHKRSIKPMNLSIPSWSSNTFVFNSNGIWFFQCLAMNLIGLSMGEGKRGWKIGLTAEKWVPQTEDDVDNTRLRSNAWRCQEAKNQQQYLAVACKPSVSVQEPRFWDFEILALLDASIVFRCLWLSSVVDSALGSTSQPCRIFPKWCTSSTSLPRSK